MKSYLILYNLIQTFGWTYAFYKAGPFLHFKVEEDSTSLWDSLEIPLKIFQSAALLEVLHSIFGIVKSNVLPTAFQNFGRVVVVWCILDISPPSQKCIGLPILTVAWCITEIVRYAYYLTTLLKIPSAFQWLRYSTFIILYPIGSVGELICIFKAIGYVKDKAIWTHLVPTVLNFGISYHYIIIALLIIFVPLTPTLYIHMLSQRKKILGKSSKRNKSK